MQGHYRTILLIGLLSIFSTVLMAQRVAKVKNVGLGVKHNKAIIRYDLKSSDKVPTHSVQLKFLDKQYNLVTPSVLSGDVGANISNGSRKTIEWDLYSDIDLLGEDITPVIFVDGVSKQFNKTGGPGYAALSLLIPGLGDYFVADHRMMKFKPYLKTLTSYGLIGLGIYAGNQRYRPEGAFITVLKPNHYQFTGDERFMEVFKEGDLQYWLFKGDKELFITLGAVVWVSDIIWVLVKGSNNKKFIDGLNKGSDFNLGYTDGGFSLKYSLTF